MKAQTKPEYIGGMTARDREQVIDVTSRSFSTYESMTSHLGRVAFAAEGFDSEFVRVVRSGGKVVAAVVITPRTMRFGPARIPAASIGPVCTDSRYRKQGYASVAMRDAVRFLRERGIPDFYHRFGFYPYRWSYVMKLRTGDALKAGAAGRLRKLAARDREPLKRLYARVAAERLCSADRDESVWHWLLDLAARHSFWSFNNPRAILDGRGRFLGYFTSSTGGDVVSCQETILEPRVESFRAALGAIGRFARKSDRPTIEFWMPPDDPLAGYCAAHVPTRVEMATHPTGGPLMCVLDFGRLMTALAPLFAERLTCSEYAGRSLRLSLRCGEHAVGLSWRAGRTEIGSPSRGAEARIPPRYFSGVLTGFYDMCAAARYPGVVIPERLLRPLSVLFPVQYPMVTRGDDM